jgi:hypothetical protein
MEIASVINLCLFLIVSIRIYWGLDLRKWKNWMVGLYGFFSGFFIGTVFTDVVGGIKLGFLLFTSVLFVGSTIHKNRQRFNH